MTRALLMLTGGRGIPDLLAVKHLRPDKTFVITTEQGLASAKHLKNLVKLRFGCELEIMPTISPFNEQNIKEACSQVLEKYPGAEWIMNITSAPKIVSIFAMDVAREREIACWFLNTNDGEVISLAETIPIEHKAIFDIQVEEYMDGYQRQYKKRGTAEYREKAEAWYTSAQLLAQDPISTHLFLRKLRAAMQGKRQNESLLLRFNIKAKPFFQQLAECTPPLVKITKEEAETFECMVFGGDARKFLEGDWLEVFVCQSVEQARFAEDYQWGYQVYNGKDEYELDSALTSRAILLIGECKTDDDPFTKHSDYLDTLDANARLLGSPYVSKFFITNHPNPESLKSYEAFYQQATQKKIRIINADELPNIGEILKQEALKPTFPRI